MGEDSHIVTDFMGAWVIRDKGRLWWGVVIVAGWIGVGKFTENDISSHLVFES